MGVDTPARRASALNVGLPAGRPLPPPGPAGLSAADRAGATPCYAGFWEAPPVPPTGRPARGHLAGEYAPALGLSGAPAAPAALAGECAPALGLAAAADPVLTLRGEYAPALALAAEFPT
jgi:hypothetical protein